MPREKPVVIAGAGVAGLSAAYRLQEAASVPCIVFEKHQYIGGCSRTLEYNGFRFDLGGHRFYTKKPHVEQVVRELVGPDLLTVDRLSRILLRGRFVNYPLDALSTLRGLGMWGAWKAVRDYAAMRLGQVAFRQEPARTFEQWALRRFGRYLYEIYFGPYTEKTWGVPCAELSADFARQRIRRLSFRESVKDALLKRGQDESLVRQFLYPRFGFGQIPEAMARAIRSPSRVLTGRRVVGVRHEGGRITAVTTADRHGHRERQACSELINSISVTEFVQLLKPRAPEQVRRAAAALSYRDMVILLLTLDVEQVSPDHWIYLSSPDVGPCRLHEPKNWSPEMAPPARTSLVVEYFCSRGDKCWSRKPQELAAEAVEDLERVGLVRSQWVDGFTTVRLPRAYPVYRIGYRENLRIVNDYLARFENLQNVGRSASFLYTSSDHYIDMGLKAAENVLGGGHDLSRVGRRAVYAEA